MPKIQQPITECPKCGGAVWDNRANKKNPKSPDFKCKDKDACGEAYWLDKPKEQKAQPSGPKWTWPELSRTYERSLKLAVHHIPRLVKNATPAEVIAGAATIFIAASRDGVKPDKPTGEPKPPLDEPPPQLEDSEDDDLPF